VPTLLTCGEFDFVSGGTMCGYHHMITSSQLYRTKDGSHLPWLEFPNDYTNRRRLPGSAQLTGCMHLTESPASASRLGFCSFGPHTKAAALQPACVRELAHGQFCRKSLPLSNGRLRSEQRRQRARLLGTRLRRTVSPYDRARSRRKRRGDAARRTLTKPWTSALRQRQLGRKVPSVSSANPEHRAVQSGSQGKVAAQSVKPS
jgi:hypothetical protein